MFYVYLVPGLIMLKFFIICFSIMFVATAIAAMLIEGVKKLWSRLS